jgi:hypothetical protein
VSPPTAPPPPLLLLLLLLLLLFHHFATPDICIAGSPPAGSGAFPGTSTRCLDRQVDSR